MTAKHQERHHFKKVIETPLLIKASVIISIIATGNLLSLLSSDRTLASEISQQIPQQLSQTNEPERTPDGQVIPVNGMLSVKLTNPTNAEIVYQAVAESQLRTLAANSSITLKDLKLPVSILFRRKDDGLLKVMLNSVSEGIVEVTFEETTDLGIDKRSLSIRGDGALFLR
ncbi:MAG: hypothetical protein ACM37W_06270 [Actinomycetota bacterium]